MNYYERIEKSMVYIEENLTCEIEIDEVVKEAYMSKSNFYRLFFAIVGYSIKEYIRLRRINMASIDLVIDNAKVIDVAYKYCFSSPDSFSKSFKRITGYLPRDCKRYKRIFEFERIKIMDKYFSFEDKALLEKYPNIKVLKEVKSMRVAYYNYYGKEPERKAFDVIKKWLKKNKIKIENGIRIFGYNNPSPESPYDLEYGYEVCVTIGDDILIDDQLVKEKILEGGLYAVTSVKWDNQADMGQSIMSAWKEFTKWLADSKYVYGNTQWLEEHLGFDEENNHIGFIDIYMPITYK